MQQNEVDIFLQENLKFDPITGKIWWAKQNNLGRPRKIDVPLGKLNRDGYLAFDIRLPSSTKTRRLLNHRVGWFLYHGVWPESFLDHTNGERTDNKITNLRNATMKQNNQNRRKNSNSSSIYKGVSWEQSRFWKASIQDSGSNKRLGNFIIEEDAARAYDKAAKVLFGEFARLNFPEDD